MSSKKELEKQKKISKLKEIADNVAKGISDGVKGASKSLGTGGIAGAMASKENNEATKKGLANATKELGTEMLTNGIAGAINNKDENKKKKAGFR